MNPIFASDLRLMMGDFGVPMCWGAYRTQGILSVATDDLVDQDGMAIVRGETPTVTYPAFEMPGLKRKELIQLNGAQFMVRHIDLQGDGLEAIAYLEKA